MSDGRRLGLLTKTGGKVAESELRGPACDWAKFVRMCPVSRLDGIEAIGWKTSSSRPKLSPVRQSGHWTVFSCRATIVRLNDASSSGEGLRGSPTLVDSRPMPRPNILELSIFDEETIADSEVGRTDTLRSVVGNDTISPVIVAGFAPSWSSIGSKPRPIVANLYP